MAITRETLKSTITPMNLIGDGLAVYAGISDYKEARKNGNGKVVSAAKAVGSGIWSEMYYSAMNATVGKAIEGAGITGLKGLGLNLAVQMGVQTIQAGAGLAGMYWENTGKKLATGYAQKGKFGSGYFDMTEAGYTMRQRSLQAIRSNGLNTNSVLGNEARTYFRSSL